MRSNTIKIALKNGATRECLGRHTPVPGLAITGTRGNYDLTHVQSGYLVCMGSLWNTNPTLELIRNAMMQATMVDMLTGGPVDWDVAGEELDRKRATAWVESVCTFVARGGK